MSIKAFVDNNYPSGNIFCEKFLSSSEFTVETLRKIAGLKTSRKKKEEIVRSIMYDLGKNLINRDKVIKAYVEQPRQWLSLRLGQSTQTPELKSPTRLLEEFGKEGWYGPIKDLNNQRKWYIRTTRINDYIRRGSGLATQIDPRYIRWSVIAEIGSDYSALFWNNFSCTPMTDEKIDAKAQFRFWDDIPQFFDELSHHLQVQWTEPNLHYLVLQQMWDKYLENQDYRWQHLRIRAEAAGVALNAHSSGIAEIDVRGLQALVRKLAKSATDTLGLSKDLEKLNHVENALLRTLIKEWGTKSYEFSLEKIVNLRENNPGSPENKPKSEKLFKAHCYFGLKPNSKTQDSLQLGLWTKGGRY